jgi:hypothetical protein
MENVIRNGLMECHYLFPEYGRKTADLEIIAKIFVKHLTNVSEQDIAAGFDIHIKTGDRFPTPKDILAVTETVLAYRMNNGPEGWGAVYAADHPYVRDQRRHGTDLGGYAIKVPAHEHRHLHLAARSAPGIEVGEDDATPIVRPRSGFRRLVYEPEDA